MTRALYVLAFVLANVITASTEPASIGPWLVTWGTWVVGFSFILRDRLHVQTGRRGVYGALAVGIIVAAATSWLLGDTLLVLAGSCLAILLAEAADTEVFARLRRRLGLSVAASGLVGAAVDSAVFPVVGLGLSGIVPWNLLPGVMVGQFVVKGALQLLAGALVVRWPRLVTA
jgi:queuosine precursor transporter